jgi:hypothetical protein
MKTCNYPPFAPVRRALIDPRSSRASSIAPVRKTLLNDRRSTR